MVTTEEFVQQLLDLNDPNEQRRLIGQEVARLTDEEIQRWKARANDLLRSNRPKGLELADNIIFASHVSGKPLHRALGLMVLANAHRHRAEYQTAITFYDEAQQIALEVGSRVEAARSQIGKIGALMFMGQYQEALAIALPTAETLYSCNELVTAATAYSNAGACYNLLDQNAKALEVYQKAQTICEQAGTEIARKELQRILNNISMALRSLGRYHEALECSLQAGEIARHYGLTHDEAISKQQAATCYYSMGDYNKALRLLYECQKAFRDNHQLNYLMMPVYRMAECYLELGRYEEAVEQAQEHLSLLEQNHTLQTGDGVTGYIQLGRALLATGQLDEAAQALSTAQTMAEELKAVGYQHYVSLLMAEMWLARQEPTEADRLLTGLLTESDKLQVVQAARLLLARVETERANFSQAQALISQAIADFEKHGQQSGLYESYYRLAEISEQQGDRAGALGYLERSMQQLEHLRSRIAAESRSVFLRSKGPVYEAAVYLTLENEQVENAFNLAERVKSRALVELVGNQLDIRVRVRDQADEPTVAQIEELRRKHNDATRRLAVWQTELTGERPLSQAEREALLAQTSQFEKQLTRLTEQLQIKNAAYAEDASLASAYRSFDLTLLEPDEGLVEYYVTRDEVLAFVVSSKGVQVVRRLTTLSQLNRHLSFFRLNLAGTVKNLSDGEPDDPQVKATRREGLVKNSQARLQKLYDLLWKPLAGLVEGYCHLIIVPHGSLHYLPFHALYNGVTNQYLVESFEEISYLPSASLLRFCRERSRQSHGKGALVFGYSNGGALPYTIEEASMVATTLGCCEEVEQTASLARFRADAPGKQIIHLATHGRYREDAPLFSSLLLSEGELTGHELFNMELQASLVTLSACESGLGTVGGGDELLGLSRACLYAGASSLALSLWRVNDQAGALLMQEFYLNLLKGQTKAASLRQAQLSLLNHPAYRHPFYWASFVLIGDSGPL